MNPSALMRLFALLKRLIQRTHFDSARVSWRSISHQLLSLLVMYALLLQLVPRVAIAAPIGSSATTKAAPVPQKADSTLRSLFNRATGAIESLFAADPGNPAAAALPTPTPANGIAIVRHAPSLNGNGRVEGSLRQLTGESVTLNSGAVITNDLQVPGTPTLVLNGNPTFGGTIQGSGSSQPTNYQVILNGGTTTLGHLVNRTDPITLANVSAPPTSQGTRSVTINAPGQSAGDFATLRDLTLNGNVGNYSVPPGTYRNFIANSGSGFVFGISGASQPSTYNLTSLTLNGQSQIQVIGPVNLTLGGALTLNASMGSASNPAWLNLQLSSGGVTLNSGSVLYALVKDPSGTVIINANSQLVGTVACDRLTINGGGLLRLTDSALPPVNQPPTVSAGSNQTITLPNSASLNGSATDDGLPQGSSVTITWSKVSGPGSVTFANASNAVTTATFSQSGTYVLRLSASDTQLTSSSDVTITVIPQNHAPTVNAGPDQTITLPAGVTLNGSAADDGLPNGTLSVSWSKVSGPGAVNFTNPNAAVTSASFSVAGTYTLRLTASDSQLASSDDVIVTVNPQNQPPIVNAGPDQTITLPSTAQLNGSATDDGLPAGGSLSKTWSQVSGPGTVTFGSPNAAVTSATFSVAGTYTLRLTASDSQLSSSDDVVVTVNPQNHAPTANAGPDQTIALPNSANLNGSVSDDGLPTGSSVTSTWTKVSGPGTVTFGNPNVTVTTASFSAAGTYVLRLTANDSQLSASDDITINVNPQNQPPTVNAGADQTITLPSAAQLNGTATDDGLPTGSTLSKTWSKVSGPGTVTFTNPNAAVTNASFSVAGTYTLRLTASDSQLSSSDDVVVTVNPQNQAPSVNAGPDQTITLPSAANLNGSVSDDGLPSGGTLTTAWSKVSGPGTVTFANPNVTVTTASFSVAGSYVLRLTANDSQLSASDDITINVNPQNQPPTVNAGPDQTITLPNTAQLNGTATDDGLPSGGSLSISWSKVNGPGTVTFTNPNAAVTSATFGVAGSYTLRLTANDSQLSSSDDVVVTVNPQNHAPTADAGPDQTITLPNSANLNGSVSDDGLPTGSSVTSTWTKVSGPGTVTFGNPNVTVTSAAFSVSGSYVLRLTANDSQLSTSDDITITVNPQNQPPTVSAGPDQTITLPNTAQLNGTATDDGLPTGSTLSKTWSKVSGPGTVTFGSPNAAVTTVSFSVAGTYTLRLTASDSQLSSSDDAVITVSPENQPPTVNAGPDQTDTLPNSASLNGSVSDDGLPSGGALTTTWTKVSGPGNVTLANPNVTVTTASFSLAGTYVLRLTANDSQLSATDDITITVNPQNQPPTVNAGPDITSTLPATVTLNGAVSDDGLPAGSSVSTNWSTVSGPGTVTFANPNVTATTASFSAVGIYVLRLTASDSELSNFDEATIAVTSPNQPPIADFGLPTAGGLVQLALSSYSSYFNDGYESYHPKQVLDASPYTAWLSNSYQVTNQFLTFRTAAGQPALIDRARMQSYYAGGDQNVKDFEIQVSSASDSAADFHPVFSGTLQQAGTDFQEFVFPGGPVSARYIKLVLKNNYGSGNNMTFATFQVIANGTADGIISFLGQPNSAANQSPALVPNGGAIYDFSYGGGTNTADPMLGYYRGGWITTTTSNQFAIVQLGGGKVYTLDGVKLATWVDSGYGYPTGVKDFEIWVSATTPDAAAFTKVLTSTVAFDPRLQTFLFPGGPVQAKFVKYVPLNNGGGGPVINTPMFDVIAEGVAKVVGASGQLEYATNPPEQAFDGNANTFWYGPNGAGSDVWVKTSLEDETIHKVYGVRITPLNSYYYGLRGPKDFDIRVSTTTTDESAFTTAYSGTLTGAVSNNAQEFVFSNPVDAKYVEFYWKNSYSGFQIAVSELEVMASSAHGSTLIGYSSSNDPSYQGPTNALDIDLTNPWFTASGENTDQWLKLLLPNGDLWTIDHVALMPGVLYYGYNGNQDLSVSPKDFEVQVSTTTADDSAFSTVFSGTLTNTLVLQYFYFPQTQARYVRLLLKNNYGSDKIALNSFYVFTPDHGSTDARFVDRSTDSDGQVVAWSWNFGDGGSSTEQSPLHHYAAVGTYTVTLTVTDYGGLTGSHQLIYHASPPLTADLAFSPVVANEGAEFVRFTDTTKLLVQPYARRHFDFGNGFTVNDLYQANYYPYQFPDNGTFNVTMTIGDINGIRYSVTKPITVLNLPPAVTVEAGKTVLWGQPWTNAPQMSDPSPIDSQTLHGVWNFGDGQTSVCVNCTNASGTITHAYALPGVYTATLTVTDKDGGATTANATYTVKKRPTSLTFTTTQLQPDGQHYLVRARLNDTYGGLVLPNKPVQFSLNGVIANGITNANGVAEAIFAFAPNAKVGLATAAFNEDDMYEACGGAYTPPPSPDFHPAGTRSSKGTDFWLMFIENYIDGYGLYDVSLFITADEDTSGTIILARGSIPFTVPAHGVAKVPLSFAEVDFEPDTIVDKGIHVTSLKPVSVYGLNHRSFTSDAYLGLPTNALGTDYITLGYANGQNLQGSEFGIVAPQDGTVVTITPAVTTGARTANVPYQITLNQRQVYMLTNFTPGKANDLSRSIVTANKPIAVISGHLAASIPDNSLFADHLVEQLPSTDTWGKHFVTMPMATRLAGDTFRILASVDNTHVYVNGARIATLNRAEFYEKIIKEASYIVSDQPILVAQYSNGTAVLPGPAAFDPTLGDPSMMLIPPYEQFLESYTFVTLDIFGFDNHHVNVVAPTTAIGAITLDGAIIPASSFVPIGSSGFSGTQLNLSTGTHNLAGPQPFGAHVYGFGQDVAYAFPGGMNLVSNLNTPTLTLNPKTSTRPVGAPRCESALLTDQSGVPLGNQTITFTVSGVNNRPAQPAITDATGQTQFCYTGTNIGSDVVLATAGSASDTASVQWLTTVPNQAPVVNAGVDQTTNLPAPVLLHGSVTDDGLPSNTLNITWSKFSGPGNVTFSDPAAAVTSATFDAAGVYVLRLTANDTDLSTSDDVQINVNPAPTNQPPTTNAGPDQSTAIKGNLIVNGGNDLPLVNGEIPGWMEVQGTAWTQGNSSIAGLPDPYVGNSFFYVGDGTTNAELRQDIDVSAFATNIAAGTQQFQLQAALRQAQEYSVIDQPHVVLEYRNAQNNGIIGVLDSYSVYSPSTWTPTESVHTVPVGTGWIRVRLLAQRNIGPTNDGYFDSVSLRPVGNAAVKLNGAVGDDGLPYGSTLTSHWAFVSGPGAVTFTNADVSDSAAVFTTPGAYVLRLTASDGQASTADDVTINVAPVNQPPTVNSGNYQTITLPANATLNAIVSDDGLPQGSSLSSVWKKEQGPGMVTFANAHAASTTASFSTPGYYALNFAVDDSEYAASTVFQVYVNPAPNNQPPMVSAGPDQTISLPTDTTTLNGSAADDGLPSGSTLSILWTKVSGPGTVIFGTPNAAVTTAQFSVAGTYVLRLTASDGELSVSDDVNVTVTAANQAPTVNAGADQTTILSAGAQLNGTVSDDGLPTGSNLTTTWSKVSGPGTVTFLNANVTVTGAQFSATGTYVLRLTANDGALSTSDDVTIIVNDNVPPPTVQITAPADDSSVTESTIVTGSVSGGAWTLEYSLDSSDDQNSRVWTSFASGNGAASGTLGTIDPTMMLNGLFDIRLSATDQYGQTSRTRVSVIVERNLKVGNFTVSFTDLSIPVAGVPMEVTRTYDSRDKRVGDFGFGWSLGLHNIRVEKSSVVGLKWYETVSQEVFPNYCLEPVGSHAVTVTFPGGKVFKFQPNVAPHCQRNAPITAANISFTAMPGTVGKLEVVGSSDVQIDGSVPGPVNLIGFGSGVDIFNSFVFKFTAEDGTAYIIDQRSGLQSLSDPNGNTLTISAGGIVHSSGKSIVFNRDIAGRITSIVDPNGNSMTYGYDPNGDLISYTDNENNTSTYTYDANHRLQTIHDPRGIQPIRNDYDPSGRLISHTDGFGKVITYLHDIPNRTETITDRLGHPTVLEYDERGNVLRLTDARGGVMSSTYDANDNVLTETNALGKTTTYTYDANNHPLTVTDPLGHLIQFTYNALGRVLTMTDPLGHVTTNTYNNTAGNLLTSEDSLHNVTSFTYSIFGGQLASTTDALNNTTQFEYTAGRLTKKTDALGNVTTFTYDSNGNRASDSVKRTNAQGQLDTITTSYEYDKLNRPKKTTFADGSFSQVEYNSIGKQSVAIDQLGHRTEFTYDDMGRLIKTTYPDGTHEDTTYDAEGRKLTNTDRAGHVTSCVYDELGRVTKVIFADGTFTQTGYDAAGQVLTTTDARGNITRFFYDDSGRRTKARNPLSQETTFTYDDNGDQLTITDALSHTLTYEYDLNNRRTKTIYNDTTFDSVGYDAVGRTVSKTDQAGKSTLFIYDVVGRLTKVKDALNQETIYGYDELGQQTSRTDANNHITRFEYDQLGRRVKRILPGGQSETYAYDIGGNLGSKTNFNGKTTTFAYDTMRRLLSRTPDASLNQAAISFTYNATGQRATMSDSSGVTTYAYDMRNRLSSKQTPFGALTYTYDEAGSLLTTRSSNANGVSVDYSYDALNRLSAVKDNNLTPLNGGLTNYVYDSVGNLQSYTYPNGVTTSYAYNSLNRLTTMTAGTPVSSLASYSYTLGATGNRAAVTELGGRSVSYIYDDLYRLTNESIANDPHGVNGSASYSFDAVGNRLSRTSTIAPVPSQSATYDANDRLDSDIYDNNGNTKTANGNSYVYDFENHLTSLNGGNVTYVYDGDGNRVSRTVNGVTTNYLVDANNPTGYAQVVDELQSGAVVRSYAYGHALISQRIVGGAASFFQYDGQGSVRQLTNAAAAVTDAYDYDAFGNLLHASGSTPNEHLYSGEQFDANLGSYNLRARLMNPTTGRFMTMDSFEGVQSDPRSLHKYLYGFANPVTNADPSGNSSLGELAITVGVGAVISSMATFALNILTASTAVANADENFSFDGFLVSGRLTESGYGGTVEGGLDVVYDIKKGQIFVALAAELGTAPVSIFKTRRGAGYSLMGGFVIGMHDPSELSGRGTSAVEPLALWALQFDVGFGGGRGKASSLLMHLAKRVKNRIGYSATVGVSASGPAYFQIGKGTFFSSTVTEDGPFVPITDVPEDVREYAVALGELTSSLARKIHDAAGLYENGDAFLLELQGFNY